MSLPTFLQDKRFLQEVDKLRIKEEFIKITVLNWNELPLQEVQGSVISGSVNLDGNSAMRRTATLSIYAEEKENNLANIDHLFAINKKCKIELGIVNTVANYNIELKDKEDNIYFKTINYQEKYGEIIWFPLGIYVMFNPSIAHDLTGVTISMNLKDKMCLLNGDLGGLIHSAVDFAYQDELVDASSTSIELNPTLIYNIIKELVNHWGNEPLNKIIISEVPMKIKQTVKWIGQEDIYLITYSKYVKLFLTRQEAVNYVKDNILSVINEEEQRLGKIPLTTLLELLNNNDIIVSYHPGYDIGFKYTDFVFPGELVCNAGDTVASVLDKIIGVLGNYLYFYDVLGNFRFQLKQNYLNMTNTAYWAKELDTQNRKKTLGDLPSDTYEADIYRLSKPTYNFIHNEFITAYNNSLNYNNIKNDFVVWGARPIIGSSEKIPCRFHLAIDKKPELAKHSIALYNDGLDNIRAVIYIPEKTEEGTILFPDAEEKYQGKIITVIQDRMSIDWRELIYYQMLEDEPIGTGTQTEKNNTYFQYYAELKEEFPKIFDLEKQAYKTDLGETTPDQINYFLDFIDDNSKLGQYSVNNIGRRAKIIEDNNEGINCVFEPSIPDIVYLTTKNQTIIDYTKDIESLLAYGQEYTQILLKLSSLLVTGGIFNSCFEKIKDLLYQYTHVNNTISITSLPIYYLEPNTRISVEDDVAGIYGDYIIQSISLPLDVSSTMTINAYKALQKI